MTNKSNNMITKKFGRLTFKHFCLLGIVVRVIFLLIFLAKTNELNYQPLQGESYNQAGVDGYLQIASTLLKTGEYAFDPGGSPVPFRPPVQPVLMLIFGAWSPQYWYIIWFCGAFLIWLATMLLSRALMNSLKVEKHFQKYAYLAIALFPYSVFTIKTPGLVVTLTMVMTLFCFSWIKFNIESSGSSSVFTGLASGLACLTHGVFMPLGLVVAVTSFFLKMAEWKGVLVRLLMAGGVAMIIVAPWTFRNYQQFGKFIPVATGGAFQYWIGDKAYFEQYKPVGQIIGEIQEDYLREVGYPLLIQHWGIIKPEDEKWFSEKATSQIKKDPWIVVRRLMVGVYSFWAPIDRGMKKSVQLGVLNLPLLTSFFICLYMALKRKIWKKTDWLFGVMLLSYMVIFALIQCISGYYIAIIPVMICWIASLWNNTKKLSCECQLPREL